MQSTVQIEHLIYCSVDPPDVVVHIYILAFFLQKDTVALPNICSEGECHEIIAPSTALNRYEYFMSNCIIYTSS